MCCWNKIIKDCNGIRYSGSPCNPDGESTLDVFWDPETNETNMVLNWANCDFWYIMGFKGED